MSKESRKQLHRLLSSEMIAESKEVLRPLIYKYAAFLPSELCKKNIDQFEADMISGPELIIRIHRFMND